MGPYSAYTYIANAARIVLLDSMLTHTQSDESASSMRELHTVYYCLYILGPFSHTIKVCCFHLNVMMGINNYC